MNYNHISPKTVGNKSNNVFSHANKVELPDSMKFPQIKLSTVSDREDLKIRSVEGSYSTTTNGVLRFKLPNRYFLDFCKAYLRMNVSITGGGGTYTRFNNGIWSIFNRIRVVAGSEIEDIREYNLYQNMQWEMQRQHDVAEIYGYSLYGVSSTVDRNAWSAGREYAMPLNLGFLECLLPVACFNQVIEIEMYLEDPRRCIESDGAGPWNIVVDKPMIVVETVSPNSGYISSIKNLIASGDFKLHYHVTEHYINNINNVSSTDIQLNHRSDSILGIISIFRTAANVNNPAINDKQNNFTYPGITKYWLNINGYQTPPEPIESGVQTYIHYLKWINSYKNEQMKCDKTVIDIDEYTGAKFFLINDLDVHPAERKKVGESPYINPFGTIGNAADILLRIEFSGPVTYQMETFVVHSQIVHCSPTGELRKDY